MKGAGLTALETQALLLSLPKRYSTMHFPSQSVQLSPDICEPPGGERRLFSLLVQPALGNSWRCYWGNLSLLSVAVELLWCGLLSYWEMDWRPLTHFPQIINQPSDGDGFGLCQGGARFKLVTINAGVRPSGYLGTQKNTSLVAPSLHNLSFSLKTTILSLCF